MAAHIAFTALAVLGAFFAVGALIADLTAPRASTPPAIGTEAGPTSAGG